MSARQRLIGSATLAVLAAAAVASGPAVAGDATKPRATLLASETTQPKRTFLPVGRLALTTDAYRGLWRKFRASRPTGPRSTSSGAPCSSSPTLSGARAPWVYRGLSLDRKPATFRIGFDQVGRVCLTVMTPRTMVISLPRSGVPRGKLFARFGALEPFPVGRVRG
jgi:hypothetical protein